MKEEEKQKVTKEVFELIASIIKLHKIDFTEEIGKMAMDLFLAGVNFIPDKEKHD